MEDIEKMNNKIAELEKQITLLQEMYGSLAHSHKRLAQAVVNDLKEISKEISKENEF